MEASAKREPDSIPCQLLDAAGGLVSAGLCELPATDRRESQVRVTALDRPGTFVQRCVLGTLTRLELRLPDGRRFAARLVAAGFTAQAGRTCLLAITPTEPPAPPPEQSPNATRATLATAAGPAAPP
jgi:hypothetical protein